MRNQRVIVITLILATVMQMFSINCSAYIPADKILVDANFEESTLFGANANMTLEESGDGKYGKSLKFTPTEALSWKSYTMSKTDINDDYTVSFDFKSTTNDHLYKLMFRSKATVSNYSDFTCVTWSPNGSVVVPTTGVHPYNLKKGADPDGSAGFDVIGKYDTNWHNVTMKVHLAGSNTLIDWYYDGEYALTADISKKADATAIISYIYIASTQSGTSDIGHVSGQSLTYDGDEAIYIDNLTISIDDEKYFYGSSNVENGKIYYRFTEPLKNPGALSSVSVVNGETGDEIAVSSKSNSERSGSVIISETLEPGVEYLLKFDSEITSISGKKLYENMQVIAPSENVPEKIVSLRAINTDGTEGLPYSSNTYSTAKLIKLYFNCTPNAEFLIKENIQVYDDYGAADYSIGEFNSSDKSLTIYVNSFLNKGSTYTVETTNLKSSNGDIEDYTSSFSVNEQGYFNINKACLVDSAGNIVANIDELSIGDVSLSAEFVNSTDETKKVICSIVYEKDGISKILLEKELSITANDETTIAELLTDSDDLTIDVDDINGVKIYGIFADENYMPYDSTFVLSNQDSITENVWKKEYSGKNEKFAGQTILADVIYPGKTHEDVKTDITSAVAHRTLSDVADDGTFSFKMKFPETAKSNDYDVYFYAENGEKGKDIIEFSNTNEAKDAVKLITDTFESSDKDTTIATIKNVISDSYYALEVFVENFDKVDREKVATLLYEYINSGKEFSAENLNSTLKAIQKTVVAESIREGLVSNLFDYAEELELDKSKLKDLYLKEYVTESIKKSVTTSLKNVELTVDADDLYDDLYEKFVIEIIKNPDGIDNLKEVLNTFSSDIGITTNADNEVYRALSGNTYASYEKIKEAFDGAVGDEGENDGNNGNNGNNGGSHGGGFSGGGGTNLGASNFTPVNIENSTEANQPEHINKNIFNDLEGYKWAEDAIVYLAEKGIIKGKEQLMFYPSDFITRAEMAKILVLTFAPNATETANTFSDLPEDWSKEYILKAASKGIIKGYDDETFRGNNFITREDAAVMIYRAALLENVYFEDEFAKQFSDEELFSDYTVEAIKKLHNQGYINGVGDNRYEPKKNMSRAEVAKIIYSILVD